MGKYFTGIMITSAASGIAGTALFGTPFSVFEYAFAAPAMGLGGILMSGFVFGFGLSCYGVRQENKGVSKFAPPTPGEVKAGKILKPAFALAVATSSLALGWFGAESSQRLKERLAAENSAKKMLQTASLLPGKVSVTFKNAHKIIKTECTLSKQNSYDCKVGP